MTQPHQNERAASQLILEICISEETPGEETPTLRVLTYPIQIHKMPEEGINLRVAAEDCARQTREDGGVHSPEPDGRMRVYPWHQVKWLQISEAEVPKLEAPARQTVTIGKTDVMSSAQVQQPLPPVPTGAPLIPGWEDA